MERIPQSVYQLQIKSKNVQGLTLARAILLSLGYKDKELVSSESKGQGIFELFNEDQAKIERVEKLFGRLGLTSIKVNKRRLAPKDWLTVWKKQWKPAALTKKLDVVPVWFKHQYKARCGCDYILMDTLLSFGTGLHETTQIMAQFIEDEQGQFKSFLDIGTGTGILSLVALKYRAQDVMAIDIGSLSVQAARDNMKANKLYFKVKKASIGKYYSGKTYDFVAANLVTEDLIKHARKITGFVKENGLLAVSGISLENLNKLRKSFSSLPLKCLKISKGEEWSGLLYQKKM